MPPATTVIKCMELSNKMGSLGALSVPQTVWDVRIIQMCVHDALKDIYLTAMENVSNVIW